LRSLADESPVSQIAEGAKKLYRRVQKTHQGADELHHGIEATHHSLSALHGPATGDDLEELQILVEDKTPANSRPFPIVGIGASAGGFEAFLALLRSLSTDSGMAFVLVQHLDPHHRSKLGELLAHSTKIPIINATDGMEVESDHIYVIPENTSMTIAKGQLHLAPRGEKEMPPMPIDAFFRSLAKEQHDLAIGVVLSGTGTDGTLGIEAIKGEGGITFAQDERSAKYEGMPRSAVATGVVDFVLPPARIAEELQQIARHPYVERKSKRAGAGKADHTGETDYHDLNEVFSLLRARTGVDFSFYKQSTLKRRIARRMVLHKMDKMGEYVALIAANPEEIDALFDDLLINVTSFFRDPKLFEMFHKKVFPRLIKEHGDGSALRMWVCGCATGEEAYSLAMCLLEFFDETRTHLPVQIFATDISESSIEKARAGLYPENIAQDVSAERLRRFFSKADGQYRVHKAIRDMVVFARQNVVIDPPFSKLDLVSCRNVLIYFGPVLQRQVMPMFHYSLRPNGYLVLGGSETIGGVADRFALIDTKHKIYQKKASLSAPARE